MFVSDEDARKPLQVLVQIGEELQRNLNAKIEMLAAAFIKEVGIPASSCELCVETDDKGIRYYFRRRVENPVNAPFRKSSFR